MNRREIYNHIHDTVHISLGQGLALLHARCSPEAAGYREFADGEGPHEDRTEAEWEATGATLEQRDMYMTWLRLLHDSKSFAKGLMWLKDEQSNIDQALHILDLRLKLLEQLQEVLDPTADAVVIQQLGAARIAAHQFICQQSLQVG